MKRKLTRLFNRFQIQTVALVSMGGLVLAWCAASLRFPIGWDQGIIATVSGTIVRGGMPYRDGWDIKGPLAYYLFAAVEWMLGQNTWALRLFDVTLLLISCSALAWIMSRITSLRTGVWTSVAFALLYGSLTWFHVGQPDGWVALLIVLGVTPLIVQSGRLGFLGLGWCSVLIGCCALIKPFYASFILVPFTYILTDRQDYSWKVGALAFTGLMASVPLLLTIVWFAHRGALSNLIEVQFLYNVRTYSDISSFRPAAIAREFLDYFWTGAQNPLGKVTIILPAIAVGAYSLWNHAKQVGVTISTWLLVALFCVAIQGKFFIYHWVPAFPPFVILAAFGLWTLSRTSGTGAPAGRLFALFTATAFLGQVAVTPAMDVAWELQFLSGLRNRVEYYEHYARDPYVVSDVMEVARHIQANTEDSDSVAVFGNEATINFLAGRPSPTRFVFGMPLTRPGSFRSAYRREYLVGLMTKRPAYVVIGIPHGKFDWENRLRGFPELLQLLHDDYVLERQVGIFDLYHLTK